MKLGLKLLQERAKTGSFWWPYISNLPETYSVPIFFPGEDIKNLQYAHLLYQEYFDINPRRYSKADYKLIVEGIEDIAARRYRQYKSDVNAYIRDKCTAIPYRGLTTEVWEKCIERSSSKKFKRDRQTQEWPSVIETFKVNHQRNGEWVNERAASDYEKMVEEREEQTQQASSSSVAVNENDVVLKATNALKSKMETYMHQMNEFITLLTSNLQSVMPGIQLPTPPPPLPMSPMHEEELDSSRDEDYLSDL
ncbi:Rubis-subs-bind domain-containing protein [Abeliophyllum distichum]|uniref:Rubis-subs-bind domain-containing protein n=1 Tax=Abeliophyllum distichum TaxID=126358 RepID=A0ABD1PNN2_9LAMI